VISRFLYIFLELLRMSGSYILSASPIIAKFLRALASRWCRSQHPAPGGDGVFGSCAARAAGADQPSEAGKSQIERVRISNDHQS
jgi:hypothetical protein